jgi:hypothetical protein
MSDFKQAIRVVECETLFIRKSGVFPLTGKGRINTYSLFQERAEQITSPSGMVGIIIPTGALTDFSQAGVTAILVRDGRLNIAFDFENGSREGGGRWFASVHPQTHFVLLAFAGCARKTSQVRFAANCVSIEDAFARMMVISADIVARMSPNTGTLMLLQSEEEARIAEQMLRVSVFTGSDVGHSLGISFSQPFNASSDSNNFRIAEQLGKLNVGSLGMLTAEGQEWWPLLEAKCGDQFNHRYGSFEEADKETRGRKNAGAPIVPVLRLKDPYTVSVPRYWVSKEKAEAAGAKGAFGWQLLYRFSAYPDNERTMIAWIAPAYPSTHIAPRILLPDIEKSEQPLNRTAKYGFLLAALNSFCFDFFLRRRMSRQGVDFFILKQTLVPHSENFGSLKVSEDFLFIRILELTYTAWDLEPFAQDCGFNGPPFRWDEARRFLLRCELDAAFFHLYGIERDDVAYIIDTFPIVKRKDEAAHGSYRTRDTILDIYDAMQQAMTTGQPYQTRLEPPAADSKCCHPARG